MNFVIRNREKNRKKIVKKGVNKKYFLCLWRHFKECAKSPIYIFVNK